MSLIFENYSYLSSDRSQISTRRTFKVRVLIYIAFTSKIKHVLVDRYPTFPYLKSVESDFHVCGVEYPSVEDHGPRS